MHVLARCIRPRNSWGEEVRTQLNDVSYHAHDKETHAHGLRDADEFAAVGCDQILVSNSPHLLLQMPSTNMLVARALLSHLAAHRIGGIAHNPSNGTELQACY